MIIADRHQGKIRSGILSLDPDSRSPGIPYGKGNSRRQVAAQKNALQITQRASVYKGGVLHISSPAVSYDQPGFQMHYEYVIIYLFILTA